MSVWLVKLVQPETRAPAAGVPVTVLDDSGNPAGYWVSDTEGIVALPRREAATIKVRVGLRSEEPIALDTERLSREIVELEAPKSLALSGTQAGVTAARMRPATDRDTPGHVMHFVRLALLPPEQPLLPAPDAHAPEPGDFLEIADPHNTELRYGALIEVEQYWQPLGHIGGELLYSAALGPGDAARVGIADGRWPDGARRPLDALAALMSPTTGNRGSDDADQQLEPLTLPLGAPLDTGLTHAAAETIQWLGERAQRAGHAMRRRPLRVVELGDAPASAGHAVRTVRAPADGPPVTYHFFEPLSRYRVASRAARLRPAVLVPFRLPNLATRAVVRQFGYILRRALLDATLAPEIDKILGASPPVPLSANAERGDAPVSELRLIVQRAPAEHAPDLRQIWCFLHVDQARYTVHFFPADPPPAGVSGPGTPQASHWIGAIRLADFHQRPLSYPGKLALQNGSAAMLAFSAVHVEGRVGDSWVRLFSTRDMVLPAQAQVRLASLSTLASAPGVDPGEGRLFAHLAAHLPYYAGAVITGGDPGARYLALARLQDHAGRPLADVVENQVAAVVGNYLAFPLRSAALAPPALRGALEHYAQRPARAADEIVVTVPVPGVWISRQEAATEAETEAAPDSSPRSQLHRSMQPISGSPRPSFIAS